MHSYTHARLTTMKVRKKLYWKEKNWIKTISKWYSKGEIYFMRFFAFYVIFLIPPHLFSLRSFVLFLCEFVLFFCAVVKIYIFCKREQDRPFNFSLIGKIMDIACFVACVAPLKVRDVGGGGKKRKKWYTNTNTRKKYQKNIKHDSKSEKKPPTTTAKATTYRETKREKIEMNGAKHRTELCSI